MRKLPVISRADYNTILSHAEKISNGQHDFIPVLRRELLDKLNIADAESLIADLVTNKDVEFLNRVRLFLLQFPFMVEGEDGAHYQLVKRGNFCELDLVEQSAEPVVDDTSLRAIEEREEELVESMENGKAENLVDEEVKLEVRAERIRQLQADVQRGIIEIGFELIAAKKQVGHGSWANWLNENFSWTQQTANNFMRIAERFGGGKLKNVFQFQPSTLQAMLTLPRGDEEAFIESQAQAGTPVENQSAREVQESVKKWKKDKKKKSSPPFEEINLFPEEEEAEAVSQRVDEPKIDASGEYEPNPNFDSPDSELNSTPTEESVDEDASDELGQTQNDKLGVLQEETLIVNSEENSDDDLNAMRDEMQKLLAEITELMKSVTKTELVDTIQLLKSIRDLLN